MLCPDASYGELAAMRSARFMIRVSRIVLNVVACFRA